MDARDRKEIQHHFHKDNQIQKRMEVDIVFPQVSENYVKKLDDIKWTFRMFKKIYKTPQFPSDFFTKQKHKER